MPNQASTPPSEAVCFTAGIKGAAFSAGVIHAYLASDRRPPKVVAGISTGALSAAALERCYRELALGGPPSEREVRRWGWFRRYLDVITWEPLDVIWNAIPDPVDFFADKPPVSDLSAEALPPQLKEEEAEARQNYYRLVKLGLWLAGLQISIRDISRTLISRVRFKEHYGYPRLERVRFCASLTWIVMKVVLHLCFSPQFTVERPKWTGGRRFLRPLFGWPAWGVGVGIVGLEAGLILRILVHYLHRLVSYIDANWRQLRYVSRFGGAVAGRTPHFIKTLAHYDGWLFSVSAIVLTLGLLVLFRFKVGGAIRHLLTELGVVRGVLHRYTLHRKLFGLFRERPDDQEGPVVGSPSEVGRPARFPGSMHLLLVAAPLQEIKDLNNQQLWGAPGTPIVDALLAALAVPGLFPPLQLTKPAEINQWLSKHCRDPHLKRLDLIDGAAVRQNPLPALFSWLDGHPEVANELSGESTSDIGIHLVYNVPTQPYQQEPGEEPPERVNIVTAALTSLELSRRRDSKLECRQTNFVSEMELWIRTMEKRQPQRVAVAAGASMSSVSSVEASTEQAATSSSPAFPIFVDEIAPERDIKFENYLAPDRKDLLKSAACGCLRSMETLYRERLKVLQTSQPVDCADLLRQVASDRGRFISLETPGLREVCAACTRKLTYRSANEEPPAPVQPAPSFRHLNAAKPRVVFLASGGVFRGAFHIGVIGAMQAAGIRPNLIVGASVGSLMGGALGAISSLERNDGWDLLAHLCLTFLHVDKRVALTKTLKNAVKQLGVRTKNVNLSPAQLRRMVRRGGYVEAGAPPALIDAISTAFLMPLEQTSKIASEFVAGHITQAVKEFLLSVRKETLHRLDIQNALMGTSLIENAARTLLGHGRDGIDLEKQQPYHDADRPDRSISFFGTTSDLNRRRPLLLPRDICSDVDSTAAYDFVKAALSSSAFPAVFSPRQEAEVLAGKGATNVLFSDGGMFDNLPFFPAIEVLSSVQKQWRESLGETPFESLQRRYSQPDLFIAAALESAGDACADAEDILEINQRARSLKVNIKLNSFQRTSSLVDSQIERLLRFSAGKELPAELPKFMDEAVPAGVLKIVPTDRQHLNSTFAFCSSLGLRGDVVTTSIADGCFQTLKSLVPAQTEADPLLQRTLESLQNDGKILRVLANESKKEKADGIHCPFFQVNAHPFECPFIASARFYKADANQTDAEKRKAVSELRNVYKTCAGDGAHRRLAQVATQPQPSASNASLR